MKRKKRNNFGKRKIEELVQGEFIIQSEPVKRGIDNLKRKYFVEENYDTSSKDNEDYSIHVKKQKNYNNTFSQFFYQQNNLNNDTNINLNNNNILNPNPYYSAEYKMNNNVNSNYGNYNNNNFNYNYNNVGLNNNINNLLKPMRINPFSPPTITNNPNFNFSMNNNLGMNNNLFHSNHNFIGNTNNFIDNNNDYNKNN